MLSVVTTEATVSGRVVSRVSGARSSGYSGPGAAGRLPLATSCAAPIASASVLGSPKTDPVRVAAMATPTVTSHCAPTVTMSRRSGGRKRSPPFA